MNSQIRFLQNAPSGTPPAGTALLTFGVDGRAYVTLPNATTLPVGNEFFQDIATQAISAGIASQAVFTALLFFAVFAKYTLAAGSGAYTVNLVLPVTGLITPCTVEINLEFAASANPQVNIYDTSTGGTLLAGAITNPVPTGAAYYYAKFKFGRDGHWHLVTNNWN